MDFVSLQIFLQLATFFTGAPKDGKGITVRVDTGHPTYRVSEVICATILLYLLDIPYAYDIYMYACMNICHFGVAFLWATRVNMQPVSPPDKKPHRKQCRL